MIIFPSLVIFHQKILKGSISVGNCLQREANTAIQTRESIISPMTGDDGRMFPKGQEKNSMASMPTLCTTFINQLVSLGTTVSKKQQPYAKHGPGLLALIKVGLKSVMEICTGNKIKGAPSNH